MINNIAPRWRQLSGQDHWKNILDPLDFDLRHYLIHYGEMCEANYDAFNTIKASRFCGTCRYSKANLFAKTGLTINNPLMQYQVTKYLYATSRISVSDKFIRKSLSREAWSRESNWIGFVAVATDEGKKLLGRRDVVVAWRGTIAPLEWIEDFHFGQVPAENILKTGLNGWNKTTPMVHKGWYSIYTSDDPRSPYNKTSARDQVLAEVRRLVEQYKTEEISITITGHSMGAAIATLNAADIVANIVNKPLADTHASNPAPILVTAFLFACPRVGNLAFKKHCLRMNELRLLRITNIVDVVTAYPVFCYVDLGDEVMIDSTKSPYLKVPGGMASMHNLQVYLHMISGTQGPHGEFEFLVHRDKALVNKTVDALKEELLVPANWWCEKNKGMVQMADGFWVFEDHEEVLEIEM